MTPIQAFELLRERCIGEITRGRDPTELASSELLEILRLYGAPIPRFASAEAEREWEESDECLAVLTAAYEEAKQTPLGPSSKMEGTGRTNTSSRTTR